MFGPGGAASSSRMAGRFDLSRLCGVLAGYQTRGGPRNVLVEHLTDLQLWKLLKWREVEPGLGEEALEEAGLVLHPPEPGLDQHGQLADVVLGQVGQ